MDDILRLYEFGHSILSQYTSYASGRLVVRVLTVASIQCFVSLSPRHPTTIQEYLYDDNGGPAGIVQGAINSKGQSKGVTIPIEKLIIFTLNKRGGDITGKSDPTYRIQALVL